MKAIWNNKVIAEADKDKLIFMEGNWYFPPTSIKKGYFKPSDKRTTCYWKGEADYYNIDVEGDTNEDSAWYYPKPMPSAFKKTKKDFTNFVAFWNGIEVIE